MTSTFEMLAKHNHESVLFCSDTKVGLRAIIAVHDTTLGPGLGGSRMKVYASEQDALTDVLKLSRAMTYKASAAGLDLGGGKSVVILEPGQKKTPELLTAFAKRIDSMGGTYVAAGDVGSTTDDLRQIRQHTKFVGGLAQKDGGLGDSAILTSLGVFQGLKASVHHHFKTDDLKGIRVAIQGTGKVGGYLAKHLLDSGCQVIVADTNTDSVANLVKQHPEIKTVSVEDISYQDVDVFSPNAIGGLLTEQVAEKMTAKIVCGGANNPLDSASTAKVLHDKGVLYAPDFVVNAGGIIMIQSELQGWGYEKATSWTESIYDKTLTVFKTAEDNNILPWDAAKKIAVDRIQQHRANLKAQPSLAK